VCFVPFVVDSNLRKKNRVGSWRYKQKGIA
jgi:hypothetical protein